MSSELIIISAVHELNETHEEWWERNKKYCDVFEIGRDYNNEVDWRLTKGQVYLEFTNKEHDIEIWYHSGRDEEVAELIISRNHNSKVSMTGLEDCIKEINNIFEDTDFTLEVYSWYNGVDKPGGKI